MYQLAKNVVMTKAESGAVMLNEQTGSYWLLNDTGAVVMSSVVATGSTEQAVAALCTDFSGTDDEQVRRDVDTLISQLRSAGLVTS